jgi:hypothetical protein
VIDGSVVIDAVASEDPASLLADLEQLGLEVGSSFGSMVSGCLPTDSIDDVSSLSTLQFASAAFRPWTDVGDVTSQGDVAMNFDDARGLFGVDGSGITIGVLSDSFDTGTGSYAQDIASGDLPSGIQVLEDFPGGTDEGRGMMQLIHDVAPGADLAFHSAFNGQAGFANGILDLANVAGADVIVDDVLYFVEPMFQDGIIAQAVDTVVSSARISQIRTRFVCSLLPLESTKRVV